MQNGAYPRILHWRLLSLTPISTCDAHNTLLSPHQVKDRSSFRHEVSDKCFRTPDFAADVAAIRPESCVASPIRLAPPWIPDMMRIIHYCLDIKWKIAPAFSMRWVTSVFARPFLHRHSECQQCWYWNLIKTSAYPIPFHRYCLRYR